MRNRNRCPHECLNARRHALDHPEEFTLADLPVGTTATIVKVLPHMRGRKKFADVGLVPGSELVMEAHAPFGGLLRVRVMEASMALHSDDAANVLLKKEEQQ